MAQFFCFVSSSAITWTTRGRTPMPTTPHPPRAAPRRAAPRRAARRWTSSKRRWKTMRNSCRRQCRPSRQSATSPRCRSGLFARVRSLGQGYAGDVSDISRRRSSINAAWNVDDRRVADSPPITVCSIGERRHHRGDWAFLEVRMLQRGSWGRTHDHRRRRACDCRSLPRLLRAASVAIGAGQVPVNDKLLVTNHAGLQKMSGSASGGFADRGWAGWHEWMTLSRS